VLRKRLTRYAAKGRRALARAPPVGWEWIGPLKVEEEHENYTLFSRDATLRISKEEAYTGAFHCLADGLPFTRWYAVPATSAPGGMQGWSQSLGRWTPTKSSRFSYRDARDSNTGCAPLSQAEPP
jgi:hypothetical protein